MYDMHLATEAAFKHSRWLLAPWVPPPALLRRPRNRSPLCCASTEPRCCGSRGASRVEQPGISNGEEHAGWALVECLRQHHAADVQGSLRTAEVMGNGACPFTCCSCVLHRVRLATTNSFGWSINSDGCRQRMPGCCAGCSQPVCVSSFGRLCDQRISS